jgi:sulfite reductase (NADPH) flavoprotein alpha-component
VDERESTVWYLAYGANMSRRVLARRGLAPLSSEPARLDGYRLSFSHPGLLPVEPAFANLEPEAGGTVHGVLHHLSTADMARLDRMEGAEYLHEEVAVVGAVSGAVRARAYRNPHPVEGLRPSRRYLRGLVEGAREHGLPEDWVQALAAHPSFHLPVVSDVTTLLVGVAERLRRAGLRPERLRMARHGHAGRPEGRTR